MSTFYIAWNGPDLYDSVEEEGMTLTARACYWISCEIVSGVRIALKTHMPEPWQDDSWASFEFTNIGQRVRGVLSFNDENEYRLSVRPVQDLLKNLFGKKELSLLPTNLELIRKVLSNTPNIQLLREESATS